MKNTLTPESRKIYRRLDVLLLIQAAIFLVFGILTITEQHDHYNELLISFGIIAFGLEILHGSKVDGWKNMLFLILDGALVSVFFEGMGCTYGMFYSKYFYDASFIGPYFMGYPLVAGLAYGWVAYPIWCITRCLTGRFGKKLTKADCVILPFIASVLLASIDLATDPIQSTIHKVWEWESYGAYFGIPLANYTGWLECGFVIYFLYAVVMYRQQNKMPESPIAQQKRFWIYPCLWMIIIYSMHIFNQFISVNEEVVILSGQTFMTREIFQGIAITCLVGILMPGIYALIRVLRDKELEG